MAVRLFLKPPPSNKPPKPDKQPNPKEYPLKPDIGPEREVWVSIPKIDKLSLIGNLEPKHFAEAFQAPVPADYSQLIMQALSQGKLGKVVGKPKYYNGFYSEIQVSLGSTGAAINFSLKKAKIEANAAHRLRIELNPAALGADNILAVLDQLHSATGKMFKVGCFLADATVTRIDIAVDMIGVRLPEVIVNAKGQGKRAHYYGPKGALESVYVHRKFKPHDIESIEPGKAVKRKGLGTLIVRVYDKVQERLSVGLPPPFGPAPVTRVEIVKKAFGNKHFHLVDIPGLKNPLEPIRIGYAWSHPPDNLWTWLEYVECRRGGGPDWAGTLLGLSAKERTDYELAYEKYPSNLVDTKAVWALWQGGLSYTGADNLIMAAKHFSSGSHIGDFEDKIAKKPSS